MPKKYEELYSRLRNKIEDGTYKPGDKLPTESVLETWGFSRNTVRHALALLEEENLIIKRRGSGNTVRPLASFHNRSGNVAVIIPSFQIYTFPQNLNGINDGLKGWATPLLYTNSTLQDEAAALEELQKKDIDGIIVNGHNTALPNPNLPLYQAMVDKGVPVVFIHSAYPTLSGASASLNDDRNGGRLAVDHLYERGYRKICGIFISEYKQFHDRYAGYCDGLKEHGLPLNSDNILWLRGEELAMIENWTDRLLRILEDADSLIVTCDANTIEIYNILHNAGKKVPDDIGLLSFDNLQFSEYAPVPVTSIDCNPYEVGFEATQLLKDRLAGKKMRTTIVPWSFKKREST